MALDIEIPVKRSTIHKVIEKVMTFIYVVVFYPLSLMAGLLCGLLMGITIDALLIINSKGTMFTPEEAIFRPIEIICMIVGVIAAGILALYSEDKINIHYKRE